MGGSPSERARGLGLGSGAFPCKQLARQQSAAGSSWEEANFDNTVGQQPGWKQVVATIWGETVYSANCWQDKCVKFEKTSSEKSWTRMTRWTSRQCDFSLFWLKYLLQRGLVMLHVELGLGNKSVNFSLKTVWCEVSCLFESFCYSHSPFQCCTMCWLIKTEYVNPIQSCQRFQESAGNCW